MCVVFEWQQNMVKCFAVRKVSIRANWSSMLIRMDVRILREWFFIVEGVDDVLV